MTQLRFFILTGLSSLIAFCLLLQIVFVHIAQSDQARLRQTEQSLQQGQQCLNRLEQFAQRIGQVAQQQQDSALHDLLTRQNIQIKNPPAAASSPAPAAEAPSTH